MLLSMTGHGAAVCAENGTTVTVDLRTINNRYFKLALRGSESGGVLETMLEELVRERVRRGTVQMDLRIDRESGESRYQLNEAVLAQYARKLMQLSRELDLPSRPTLDSLLSLPGVVIEHGAATHEPSQEWPLIRRTTLDALRNLHQMRIDEGQTMARDLLENLQIIRQKLDQISQRTGEVSEIYRTRLAERINKMLEPYQVTVQTVDLIREVGLLAERSDVSEELVRLRSHVDQFQTIMELPESQGRKLEFVTQEMFREANTIGSKANHPEITGHVVEIKATIERIREMIQNIE